MKYRLPRSGISLYTAVGVEYCRNGTKCSGKKEIKKKGDPFNSRVA